MSQGFYVSPEQLIKDRADFAKKGIAKGRSVIVRSFKEGIVLVADNPSPSLRKIAEIHDNIAFAAVGKYNEFEALRQAGIRWADVRDYAYDRTDVTGRGLASVYSQLMATGFTGETKPFEVELVLAEVGHKPEDDHLFKLGFDGSIVDQQNVVVMGGKHEEIFAAITALKEPQTLAEVIQQTNQVLENQRILEVGWLKRPIDKTTKQIGQHRSFTRLSEDQLAVLLKEGA